MHSAAGPCNVVANGQKADVHPYWRKLPPGWRRCPCQDVQRTVVVASKVVTDDLGDDEDEDEDSIVLVDGDGLDS
jgi:hypothetical protein